MLHFNSYPICKRCLLFTSDSPRLNLLVLFVSNEFIEQFGQFSVTLPQTVVCSRFLYTAVLQYNDVVGLFQECQGVCRKNTSLEIPQIDAIMPRSTTYAVPLLPVIAVIACLSSTCYFWHLSNLDCLFVCSQRYFAVDATAPFSVIEPEFPFYE